MIRLIVGLGNPGSRYKNSWHNLGATVIEILAERWKTAFKPGKGSWFSTDHIDSHGKTTLMFPTSYMNRSGGPVGEWVRYYKVEPEEILIIYDDHDLPLGRIRLRERGSSGGHNGMDDIIRCLSTDGIPRLKIGIRTAREKADLAGQVLSIIPKQLKDDVGIVIAHSIDAIGMVRSEGILPAADKYNGMELLE